MPHANGLCDVAKDMLYSKTVKHLVMLGTGLKFPQIDIMSVLGCIYLSFKVGHAIVQRRNGLIQSISCFLLRGACKALNTLNNVLEVADSAIGIEGKTSRVLGTDQIKIFKCNN